MNKRVYIWGKVFAYRAYSAYSAYRGLHILYYMRDKKKPPNQLRQGGL